MNTAMNVRRPALRYHGGKWTLAPQIIRLLPKHRVYCEPYGGGASVLLRKPSSYAEIYNDLDGEIVNVFRQLRDHGPALKTLLQMTPFAREEFVQAYEPSDDPLEAARRTIIKSFMGFGSDAIRNVSGFRANSHRSGTTPAHDWVSYAEAVDALIARLRGVVIERRDALEVIAAHDKPTTLFYVDPPYVHSTRSSDKRYLVEMDDSEHRALAATLHHVKGKVVLSGYASPLYRQLYGDWQEHHIAAMADGGRPRVEMLWTNFDDLRLF